MNPKDQLAEIEKEIEEHNCPKALTCQICLKNTAKLQGFLLGTISQLKEEIKFLKDIFTWSPNAINRVERLTADLKFYEDKLKEMGE